MSLKQMTIRYDDTERELMKLLAEKENLDVANAVRLALREALEKRGIEVPEGAFSKKQEGRPKDLPTTTIEGVGRQSEVIGAVTPITST